MSIDRNIAAESWERMKDRFRGAMLGVAIGDALGAPLEGSPMPAVSNLGPWIEEPPRPMRYTDDTHMTLATAASLVERRGFDVEHMAQALATQYEREPWRGYGAGPPRIFRLMRKGRKWKEASAELFGGKGSFGNGAAMRIVPIGLLHCEAPERVVEIAREAARITHFHPLGEDGAVLQAAAVAKLVASPDTNQAELLEGLRQDVRTNRFQDLLDKVALLDEARAETVVRELGNGIEAHHSVPTALHCFLRHRDSFADALLYALSLGGDADTIGSMTGALTGAAVGASSIPRSWSEGVEGRDELVDLSDRLLELVIAPR
ncbi:MAG: ADP-ribosylglycohydrolase family protein [Polyangia bacterium]